jgi:hypothetical protein
MPFDANRPEPDAPSRPKVGCVNWPARVGALATPLGRILVAWLESDGGPLVTGVRLAAEGLPAADAPDWISEAFAAYFVDAARLAEVESFIDALWLERGLSENTLTAYRSDLAAFLAWLDAERSRQAAEAQRLDLLDYLALLSRQGRKPRSTARSLSCLRQFYGHLLRQGRISEDPVSRVEAPRLGRPLPKT